MSVGIFSQQPTAEVNNHSGEQFEIGLRLYKKQEGSITSLNLSRTRFN